ncbi:hypothetical protein [Gordonia sihwensis]|uniref:hypothetical protein n=1 Tax=Gordonia sihwensis TaxID=173559 RepID=UPI003D991134
MSDPIKDFYTGVRDNVHRGTPNAEELGNATRVHVGGTDSRDVALAEPTSELGLGAALVHDAKGNPIYAEVTTDGYARDGGGRVLTPLLQRDDGSHYVIALNGDEVTIPPNAAKKGFDGFRSGDNYIGTLATRNGAGDWNKVDTSKTNPFDGGVKVINPSDLDAKSALTQIRADANGALLRRTPADTLNPNSTNAEKIADGEFLSKNLGSENVASLRKIMGSPTSFSGDVANAVTGKMMEFVSTAEKYENHEKHFRQEIAIFKFRTDAFNQQYRTLQMHINAAKTAITTTATKPAEQAQAAQRFRELETALKALREDYRNEVRRVTDGSKRAFDNYKRSGNPDVVTVVRRDTPQAPAPETSDPPTTTPPVATAPSSSTPTGSSTPVTSSPSSTPSSPSSTTDSPSSTSKTSTPQDMLSKILAGGTPVGGTPTGGNPLTAVPNMLGNNRQMPNGFQQLTGNPSVPGMTTPGGPTVMSDSALNDLINKVKPANASSPTTTPSSTSVSGNGGMPPMGSSGTGGPNSSNSPGPKQPPTQNLSSVGTRTTGGFAPSGAPGDNGGPQNARAPMGSMMPMPMGGMGGAGGAGNNGGGPRRETGLRPETDIAQHLGKPVTTTTPVVNDKKNKVMNPDEEAITPTATTPPSTKV